MAVGTMMHDLLDVPAFWSVNPIEFFDRKVGSQGFYFGWKFFNSGYPIFQIILGYIIYFWTFSYRKF
jgi:hypothetical protein